MSGIAIIGPVACDIWDAQFAWAGTPTASGMRPGSFTGTVPWAKATQLQELVANPDRQVTIGNETGVLEYVWSDDGFLRDFRGWCLLQTASINAGVEHSGDDAVVPVSISVVLIGDRQVVVPRSARALTNAFSLGGAELLAAPLTVSDGNPAFSAEPGGTTLEREFDAAHGDEFFGATPDGRTLQLRIAAVGVLPQLVLPAVEDTASPPAWVAERGGDCRAYDVSQGREVFGPSHPLEEPSDLVLENGLLRAWCGGRGIVPYFTVMTFVDGAWQQCGCVVLADETTGPQLDGARLVAVTPDRVTAALRVRGIGDVYVTLKRGERMLRVQHGTTRAPTVSATRRIGWLGTPPTIAGLGDASSGAGKFGLSIALAAGDEIPAFQWPAAVTPAAWTVAGWWIPDDDDTAHPLSGMFTIMDAAGGSVASLHHSGDDQVFLGEVGATVVETVPVSFSGGENVFFALRFDDVAGVRLTVATPNDGVVHVGDPSTAPASSSTFTQLVLAGWTFGESEPFGSGPPFGDDGPFGGAISAVNGRLDEMLVFAGRLTDSQVEALANAAVQLEGVPSTPRPVWYAPFDVNGLAPTPDAVGSGRRVELGPDPIIGMSRMVAALTAIVAGTDFAVASPSSVTVIDVMAGLATAATEDGAADLHDQFAAASEQEIRIR